uniref:Sodium-dependent nutrient amino acid transporter 1 n=1 Tax=Cacopsylla melanoneura TaxID=428564 RepID=A0A8D9B8R8_9HEMI
MKKCLSINSKKVRRTRSFLTTIQNADRTRNPTRDEVATSDMAYCGVFRSYNEHGAMPNPESSPTPTLSSRVARWQQTTSPCGLSCELNTEQVTSVLHPCESCVANSWIGGDTLSVTSFETGHSTQYKQGGGGPNGFGGPNGYSSPSPSTPMGSTSRLVAENQKNKESWKCMSRLGTTVVTLCLTTSLGNLLRLPRIVHEHGGGTFLVAYILVNVILGIPLVFLEIVLGQFCQQGTTKLWRAVPLFRGVGFVKVILSGLLAVYYVLFMALSLFYTVWSAKGPIPFVECPLKYISSKFVAAEGVDRLTNGEECLRKTFLLPPSSDMLWFCVLVTFLLIIWTFLALCIFRDVDSVRRGVLLIYPPILIAIVVLLYDVLLNRTLQGVLNLLNIDWEALLSFDIWYYAVIQFFFSTHVGFGNITTCAGRLYAKNNAFWTSVLYILMNLVTGIAFVCIVYSWLHLLNTSTHTFQASQMPELFVMTLVYDTVTSSYAGLARPWAALVFLVILLSGFVSTICLVYTVVTCAVVEGKRKRRWWTMTLLVCAIGFILTVLSVLPGDLSIVHILEHYVIGRLVLISTMLELIGFIWVYGLESLSNDFEFVLGYNLNFLWKTIWFIAPIVLGVLEVCSMVLMPLRVSSDSSWESTAGWSMYLAAWLIILLVAFWQILAQVDFDLIQKYRSSVKPTRNWGPVDPIYRHCWVQWKKQYQITGERDFTLRRRGTRDYTHSIKRGQHAGPVGSRYSIPPSSPKSVGSHYSIPVKSEAPVYTIQSYIYDEAALPLPATQNMYNSHLQSSVYVHSPNHTYYREEPVYTSTPNTHAYNGDSLYTRRSNAHHAYNSPDVTPHGYHEDGTSSQLYFMSNQGDHVCWRKNQR